MENWSLTHNLGDKRKPIINFNQNFSIYIFISQPNKPTNLSPPISSKNYYILLEDVRGCEDGGHLLGICNNFSISSPMKNNQKQNPHHTTICYPNINLRGGWLRLRQTFWFKCGIKNYLQIANIDLANVWSQFNCNIDMIWNQAQIYI